MEKAKYFIQVSDKGYLKTIKLLVSKGNNIFIV